MNLNLMPAPTLPDSTEENLHSVGVLRVGEIINDRFEVLEALTENHRYSYVCRRLTPPYKGELARLKFHHPKRLREDSKTSLARFQHEIVAAMGVRSPYVIRVDESVRYGSMFGYVSEFVKGDSLLNILERNGVCTIPETVYFLRQLAIGLDAIHGSGVILRSLKPKNIIVTKELSVKIIDFGLAKILDQRALTADGGLVGTIEYMSPDHFSDNKLAPSGDIYALGIIAYQLLTGETPLCDENIVKMIRMRTMYDPEPPLVRNPCCPPELSSIVMRALARNPLDRFQSAAEMLRELEAIPDFGKLPLPS